MVSKSELIDQSDVQFRLACLTYSIASASFFDEHFVDTSVTHSFLFKLENRLFNYMS